MKKTILSSLVFVLICSVLISCTNNENTKSKEQETTNPAESQKESSTNQTDSDRKYKIGINSYAENFESSQRYLQSFKQAAEKAGNVELVYADCNADPQKVAPNYDAFILQNVDAIIDASWMGEVGSVAVEKCKNAGIPLVTCDAPFDKEYSYLVGTDQYQAGIIAGEYLAEVIKEKWNGELDYLVFEYFQSGGPQVERRMRGCLDGLRSKDIKIEDDNVFWFDNEAQTQKTNQITLDFLTGHPDATKIIFGTNNDPCAIGVVSAVEAAGRQKDCISYSYGGEDSALDLLKKENCYIGSVSFQQMLYGDFAIPAAVHLIEGRDDVPKVQGPTPYMITRENLEQ